MKKPPRDAQLSIIQIPAASLHSFYRPYSAYSIVGSVCPTQGSLIFYNVGGEDAAYLSADGRPQGVAYVCATIAQLRPLGQVAPLLRGVHFGMSGKDKSSDERIRATGVRVYRRSWHSCGISARGAHNI